jgi:hypothetical protein
MNNSPDIINPNLLRDDVTPLSMFRALNAPTVTAAAQAQVSVAVDMINTNAKHFLLTGLNTYVTRTTNLALRDHKVTATLTGFNGQQVVRTVAYKVSDTVTPTITFVSSELITQDDLVMRVYFPPGDTVRVTWTYSWAAYVNFVGASLAFVAELSGFSSSSDLSSLGDLHNNKAIPVQL